MVFHWACMGVVMASGLTAAETTAAPSSSPPPAAKSRPTSRPSAGTVVDPRIELMSIIFRLAGNPEYNMPSSRSPYADEVAEYFTPFRGHPVIRTARRLRRDRGVSYDAVMSMAVHLTDPPELKERIDFDSPASRLDSRWTPGQARDFLEKARSFAEKTDFDRFVRQHRELYTAAAVRLDQALGSRDLRQWFDDYFGTRSAVQFHPVIGLLNGGGCYGPSFQADNGPVEMYSIIGAWRFDEKGIPKWSSSVVQTVVHEYCHSYSNPLVDQHFEPMKKAAEKIYETCAEQMARQAYGNPQTVIRESMVRACTVRYVRSTGGSIAGWAAVRGEVARGFVWVRGLSKLLAEYESARERYPTMDSFMPRVVEFFNAYARDLDVRSRQPASSPVQH